MGSSPVTATTPLPPSIARAIDHGLGSHARAGGGVLVAFSGGPDSTALLAALALWTPAHGMRLEAAHLDHGLDSDSRRRARRARALARELGVPLWLGRVETPLPIGESLEAWAREQRYAFLERQAGERSLALVATAHHADDQAETLLLRLAYGSGLTGLAGIRPQHGKLVRPFLGLRRDELLRFVDQLGITPIDDPTNEDLDRPRNRIRHHLLPLLAQEGPEPDLVPRLSALAMRAAKAVERLDVLLEQRLAIRAIRGGARLDRQALEGLDRALAPFALALLARRAGATYPAAATVRRELSRQLAAGPRVGCDVAGQWRLEGDARELRWLRHEPSTPRFAYTGRLPGVIEVPELGLRVRFERSGVAPWMLEGRPDRVGLDGGLSTGTLVTLRNRRPGDRIQPLGHRRRRRLKELLIDHRVPRGERDRLPLLVIGGEIAWVPGITIGHAFRIDGSSSAWRAVIEEMNDENKRAARPPEPTAARS